ncbi:hypothetical protein HYH03_010008 [Edaphochlamys debaryana]|uniref:DSBA-like thioredoxin domain-containing protein n=1 Tax=Edaphochlamys debaryana TaxID=47281 RepID=A0A836BX40_9CHLO|nr:hypothetical protein HYH03_010008 [Edaphochlamys debaryana]|eukprot:KAG2491637.1 hypothetical protein HYH03_010008 [Edaphochlamys debaryana]
MLAKLQGSAKAAPGGVARGGAPSTLPTVNVNVFSDPACPWCHIGAKRLQRAVRQYKRRYGVAAPLKLHWNPLLVDNDVSPLGESVETYALRRYGEVAADKWRSRLIRSGLPEGAAFADWKTVPNSILAHELVALASDMGLAEQANELLFLRTYEQGGNISLLGELLDIGEALGMERSQLRKELTRGESGPLRASVLERDMAAKQRLRIQAVPHFIISAGPANRTKYALNGAHQTSDLLGAMERVTLEETRAAAAAARAPYGGLLANVPQGSQAHTLAAA